MTAAKPVATFLDAQENHRLHPDSFAVPEAEALASLAVGDLIKVCPSHERFWCEIEAIDHDDDAITARIVNNLICTDKHGLRYGDLIHCQRRHVYMLQKSSPAPE